MEEIMKKFEDRLDKEFTLSSVEVLSEHWLSAQSIEVAYTITSSPYTVYHHTTLMVKPGVYPVVAGPSRYADATMEMVSLSPLDAYGLQSIGKAKVKRKWEN